MVDITEVTIISIDKSEDSWAIEGEVLFESDLTSPLSVTYYPQDDEFEDLEIEINPGNFDQGQLKDMIIAAANDYEEEL